MNRLRERWLELVGRFPVEPRYGVRVRKPRRDSRAVQAYVAERSAQDRARAAAGRLARALDRIAEVANG